VPPSPDFPLSLRQFTCAPVAPIFARVSVEDPHFRNGFQPKAPMLPPLRRRDEQVPPLVAAAFERSAALLTCSSRQYINRPPGQSPCRRP